MIRRPPRSTRTDTRFPYTTLVRSAPTETRARLFSSTGALISDTQTLSNPRGPVRVRELPPPERFAPPDWLARTLDKLLNWLPGIAALPVSHESTPQRPADDSEERRAGKECLGTCRSRGPPYHRKQTRRTQKVPTLY